MILHLALPGILCPPIVLTQLLTAPPNFYPGFQVWTVNSPINECIFKLLLLTTTTQYMWMNTYLWMNIQLYWGCAIILSSKIHLIPLSSSSRSRVWYSGREHRHRNKTAWSWIPAEHVLMCNLWQAICLVCVGFLIRKMGPI